VKKPACQHLDGKKKRVKNRQEKMARDKTRRSTSTSLKFHNGA
jgi:hypothetical protein